MAVGELRAFHQERPHAAGIERRDQTPELDFPRHIQRRMPPGLARQDHSQRRRDVGAGPDAFRDEWQHTLRLGSKHELVHVRCGESPPVHPIPPHEGGNQAVERSPRRVRP